MFLVIFIIEKSPVGLPPLEQFFLDGNSCNFKQHKIEIVMKVYKNAQIIGQLEKRKGGYFFLKIDAEIINQFQNKRHTRFLCTLEKSLTIQCGLNHFGDGNFFIILSGKNLETVNKKLGDTIHFELNEDPNLLGVEMPEVLEAVLEQDENIKAIFDCLTPGKKRSVIFALQKIKDIDKQIENAYKLINNVIKPRKKAM